VQVPLTKHHKSLSAFTTESEVVVQAAATSAARGLTLEALSTQVSITSELRRDETQPLSQQSNTQSFW
jgi:hypothetical protein